VYQPGRNRGGAAPPTFRDHFVTLNTLFLSAGSDYVGCKPTTDLDLPNRKGDERVGSEVTDGSEGPKRDEKLDYTKN
jgi:hypothetical protein